MVQSDDRLSGRVGSGLPIYEFNDTFDEKHLNQNLYWSLNRLYTRALDGQRGLCHLLRYNGKFSEFKRDSRVNTAFDLPYNTYTIKLPLAVINFFSSKAAKEINYTMRNQADFWRNGTPETIEKNKDRKIQDQIWRCDKTETNIMWNGRAANPMHTPDYYYDREKKYFIRDLCATTKNGTRYLIDKASYPYIYSIQETYCMPLIFTHHFAVFINGYLYSDAKFFCDNSFLYVFLCTNNPSDKIYENDLVNENIIKQWRKDEVPFTIMGFPFSTTKGIMCDGADEAVVTDEGIAFDMFEENLTPNMQFRNNIWLLGHSDPEVSTFFLKPTLAKLKKDPMGVVRFVSITDDVMPQDEETMKFPDKLQTKVSKINRLYMEAFNLKNAFGVSNIGTERTFYIPLDKNGRMHNPVPPQNILLFSYDTNGDLHFVHEAVIKLYYPNVYRIDNIDTVTNIIAMWFINTEDTTDRNLFDNPLRNYMLYNPYYKSGILYGTLPTAVMDYVPAVVEYDYTDYFIYKRSAKSMHNEYMIDKISEVMKDNPERYEYIYSSLMEKTGVKLHANPKQLVYLKDLGDLEEMAVTTNEASCKPHDYVLTFKIPHVGFRIEHHENTAYRYAIWVDGILQDIPYIYDSSFTTWIYIPLEVLYDATTLEVEMMRVTGRGRIQANVRFSTVDTSVEIPHVFEDVSPQSMLVSIRKVISSYDLENDAQKSYAKYTKFDSIFVENKNNGTLVAYRVAPDYEMSWMLFGNNYYVNGERRSTLDDVFHEDKLIEYPYFDEDGKPQVIYTEREKCKHTTLDDTYSRPEHLDWTTGSTIMTEVKDDIREAYIAAHPRRTSPVKPLMATPEMITRYKAQYPQLEPTEDGELGESDREYLARIWKLIEENEPPVYIETQSEFNQRVEQYMSRHQDDTILMPLNTAINRNYFKTSNDSYYVVPFDSPWPNGFFALERRRFYQYLPYGKDAKPLYMTPIGKPDKAEAIEAITKYAHSNKENYSYIWISGGAMKDNDVMYYNPVTDRWYSINDTRPASALEVKTQIDTSKVYLAIAKGRTDYPERVIELEPFIARAVTEIKIPNIPDKISADGIYVTAFVHKYRNDDNEYVYRIEFIPHYNPNYRLDSIATSNYELSEYTEVPGSRILVKDSSSDLGDYVYPVYTYSGGTYTATACRMTQQTLEAVRTRKDYLNNIDWAGSLKEIKKWYPNPDVYYDNSTPRCFFDRQLAIIQNTDFYYKRHYKWDFEKSMSFTTDYFYDDPSFHKFRITINGRRVDHGTDYITDIDMIEGYMRGSPITITFKEDSPTVQHAITASYDSISHISGKLATTHNFYEALVINSDEGIVEYSTEYVDPDPNTVYYNIEENNKPYIWNGAEFVEWDGFTFVTSQKIYADVNFEFLPYKDRVVWKTNKLRHRENRVRSQVLERPLSFAYYDFYLDGVKLSPDKLIITSPRSYKFGQNISFEGKCFTIYERCHDKDLYGNAGYMPDSIDDILADRLPKYREFLYSVDSLSEDRWYNTRFHYPEEYAAKYGSDTPNEEEEESDDEEDEGYEESDD